jgi:hypothetical protein
VFTPDPKPTRERLKRNSVAWKKRVDELYERENGICQGCVKWLYRNEANPHHQKTVGSGSGDELKGLRLLCSWCHVKIDSGELKLE